jgi:hypothetical protein
MTAVGQVMLRRRDALGRAVADEPSHLRHHGRVGVGPQELRREVVRDPGEPLREGVLGERLSRGPLLDRVGRGLGAAERQPPEEAGSAAVELERRVAAHGEAGYRGAADAQPAQQRDGVAGDELHGGRPGSRAALAEPAMVGRDQAKTPGQTGQLRRPHPGVEREGVQEEHDVVARARLAVVYGCVADLDGWHETTSSRRRRDEVCTPGGSSMGGGRPAVGVSRRHGAAWRAAPP